MEIHPNAYYNYKKNHKAKYHKNKKENCETIKNIYHDCNGIIGHRKMRIFLQNKGILLSKTTVHKYMNKELNLYCVCRRKKPGYKKGQAHKVFPNLLNRQFYPQDPNKFWCIDFTYIPLSNGTMRYNCTIIDLYDRCVVASVNSSSIDHKLAKEALNKAIAATDCNPKQMLLHSDQGVQFTSQKFVEHCEELGVTQSMSHAGCPYDNSPMERYFNTLKAELIYQYKFDNAKELDKAVAEFAYEWYNQIRPHSSNGYLTTYEKRFGKNKKLVGRVTKRLDHNNV